MYKSDEEFMRYALQLASQAQAQGEVPVGALVVHHGMIIGEGYNQVIGHNDPSAHAEILAMRDAALHLGNYRLPDTTVYVTIEPCSMCAGAMVHARVARLIYGASEPKAGVVHSQQQFFEQDFLNHRPEYQGGVLEAECSKLISAFFKARRKT